MNCFTCSKTLKVGKTCPYCKNKVCSESCLTLHYFTFHQENYKSTLEIEEKDNNEETNNNNLKSPYIVKGYISKQIKYESKYSLKNFVPVYFKGKPKLIGYGSFGKVFLGINTFDQKYYAIKHMEKKTIYKALRTLDTIYTEIKIQSQIHHPNIVNILFVNETEKNFDIVLENATKGNLFFYIQKNRCLSESKSFQFFIQIVNAVYFLHKNNYIHRDIKPENILLFDNNFVKLCDFGWCVKIKDEPRKTYCGTTEYMAPEMINNGIYGKEIDNWSLGILLYEMLHGYSPFRPHKTVFSDKDVFENIRFQKSIMFSNQLSNECIELINHLLEKNSKKRYNTIDIFNSSFVKNFEKLNYFFPPKNITEDNNNDSSINKILSTKTLINFYPKSIGNSREKEIIEEYSSESNNINIDENIHRKNNYIKQNYLINKEKDNIFSNINFNFNKKKDTKNKSEDNCENNFLKKKEEDSKNNSIYISQNRNKTIDNNKVMYRNNIMKENFPKKVNYNKSFSQNKNNINNNQLKYKQKKMNILKNEEKIENKNITNSLNNNNFNNINIILYNNLDNNIYSEIENNNNFKVKEKNKFFSDYNNNTINTIRIKNNNYIAQNIHNINKIKTNLRIRNSSRDFINSDSIQLDIDPSNNLIAKRIKTFRPKNSNIELLNSKSKDKAPIPITLNETKISKKIDNNQIRIKTMINYFGFYKINNKIKRIKRNSFPYEFVYNKYLNNNYKYETIQNEKDILIKNISKKNKIKKNIITSRNESPLKFEYKCNTNKNIKIENNSLEELINKEISENNSNDEENNKTPKKLEDNFQINPHLLFTRLKNELNVINKKFEYRNQKDFFI